MRPFFLGALGYAAAAMLLWFLMYAKGMVLGGALVTPYHWHGHEMVYGYTLAVIAGFLLTAVRNWTGQTTLMGWPLAGLSILWLAARVGFIANTRTGILCSALFETLFILLLTVSLTIPIARVRQWRQIGIISKLFLFVVSDAFFYVGILQNNLQWSLWGMYLGVYLTISLILMLSARVIPFFIQRATGVEVRAPSDGRLGLISLVLFTVFMFVEVFTNMEWLTRLLAVALLVVHSVRLWQWHTPTLWRKPMLAILYLGYGNIVLGFLLIALAPMINGPTTLPLHAFTVGGIGLMTAGMIARVSLGHTGRNVYQPPAITTWAFAILLLAVCTRVLLPILLPKFYSLWMTLTQAGWTLAFAALFIAFFPVLVGEEKK